MMRALRGWPRLGAGIGRFTSSARDSGKARLRSDRRRRTSLRSSSVSATTCTTPERASRCTRPFTCISRAVITTLRKVAITLGQMTRLATPVSSSSVTKQTPLALPGRWRTSTSPASRSRAPCAIPATSAAGVKPCRAMLARRKASGCAFSDRRRVW